MRKQISFLMIAMLVTTLAASSARAATITLLSQFDYPGGTASTLPFSINNNRQIVGTLFFPSSSAGFERFTDGSFALLADPAGNGQVTAAHGINDASEIVGFYENVASSIAGFTLVNGIYSDFLGAPATCNLLPCPAELLGINNPGDVVGGWFPPNAAAEQAFAVLSGVFTSITHPSFNIALAQAISNNSTYVVGTYADASGLDHGFLYKVASGVMHAINYPGAVQTFIEGINNRRTYAGGYVDSAGAAHGVAHIAGNWATYDFPGAFNFTTLTGVNDDNVATGYYQDDGGVLHGFTAQIAQ